MFFARPNEYEPCGIFTTKHFILIILTIAAISVALKKTVNKSKDEVKEIIKKEIAHNPYLGYKELVTKDLSLDIEIELEYLIESEQLIRRKPNHKNPRYRWEARIK